MIVGRSVLIQQDIDGWILVHLAVHEAVGEDTYGECVYSAMEVFGDAV